MASRAWFCRGLVQEVRMQKPGQPEWWTWSPRIAMWIWADAGTAARLCVAGRPVMLATGSEMRRWYRTRRGGPASVSSASSAVKLT